MIQNARFTRKLRAPNAATMSLTDLAGATLIELTAVDERRNCRRAYRIERTEDLFGHQLIELSWGRIAGPSQTKRLSAPSAAEAIATIRRVLARRDSATTRIGVAYKRQEADGAAEREACRGQ